MALAIQFNHAANAAYGRTNAYDPTGTVDAQLTRKGADELQGYQTQEKLHPRFGQGNAPAA
jgi:hypothetical protein